MIKNTILLILLAFSVFGQKNVEIKSIPSEKKISVKIGGKLFTNYFYPGKEVLKKSVLYPVYSPNGTLVSRAGPWILELENAWIIRTM
jgi:hypothetical protein